MSRVEMTNYEIFISQCKKLRLIPFQLETSKYKGPAVKINDNPYTQNSVSQHFSIPLTFIKLEDSPHSLIAYPNVVDKKIEIEESQKSPTDYTTPISSPDSPWVLLHSQSSGESTYLLQTELGVIVRHKDSATQSQSMVFVQFAKISDFNQKKDEEKGG